ncbi:zf-HC2 domain-containing protein [Streptomyces carpinensis]|uniref:Zf-HC2 domain-containing protein n=1 Tax=Streptomyces carpinensis TaxID=66369 RepID=A0ABV1WAI2_9ACTN|nr:zf-HC2 domain-containing protein [Streptomyces carpinensis]
MRSLERHRDVGAYALGVLDEADAFRFEDHLMECPRCTAQVTEFGATARQLLLYRRATPHFVHPMSQPGPRLLERLAGEVVRRHRAGRRRLLFGLAASVVLAVGGPAAAVVARHADGAVRVAATDAATGVWAEVSAADAGWGSEVRLRVKDGAGPHSCLLVAVGRDGSEQTVTTWMVPTDGAGPNTVMGGAALHPDQIARFEVRTADGQHLVTLDPP